MYTNGGVNWKYTQSWLYKRIKKNYDYIYKFTKKEKF